MLRRLPRALARRIRVVLVSVVGPLYRASVWAPGAIKDSEREYQLLPQLVLPFVDVIIMAAGIAGALHHVPALDGFLPPTVVDLISLTLALTALLCLVGVSFPRLYLLEMFAKYGLIAAFVLYPVTVLGLAVGGDDGRWVAAFFMLAVVPFFMLRVWVLVMRWWRAHQAHVATREIKVQLGGDRA